MSIIWVMRLYNLHVGFPLFIVLNLKKTQLALIKALSSVPIEPNLISVQTPVPRSLSSLALISNSQSIPDSSLMVISYLILPSTISHLLIVHHTRLPLPISSLIFNRQSQPDSCIIPTSNFSPSSIQFPIVDWPDSNLNLITTPSPNSLSSSICVVYSLLFNFQLFFQFLVILSQSQLNLVSLYCNQVLS